MGIIIGVDESGTGAIAGPFVVCALAVYDSDQTELRLMGARDSKKLSDARRRSLVQSIVDVAVMGKYEVAEVHDINSAGHQACWRQAISDSIVYLHKALGPAEIIIDGSVDLHLQETLRFCGVKVKFQVGADDIVPVVSAASIIAKTVRNDRMLDLHRQYPEYGWHRGSGYLTKEHHQALIRFGKTQQHRDVKPLANIRRRGS